ncbi:MAG: type II restriction endonuclease subunit R [Ignavibacteria bacterium]|nr:type II restriction endonuclease subunit R [Ignavibacteria bacterium]
MDNNILNLFSESEVIRKIQVKLPKLFQIAELESQRAGKVGMEVGSIRERIIVSLLIYKFGEENVETEIPITEPEVDVKLFGNPISIKTKSGSGYSGVKLIWTVDAQNALEFQNIYSPSCDMIYVQINWGNTGGLFCFPLNVQLEIFNNLGRENYIKLPSLGTNPRGAEIFLLLIQIF